MFLFYAAISSRWQARLKYTIRLTASTMVVIMGDAIMAGSSFNTLAPMGRVQPMVLAATTVANILMTTVTQIMVFPGYWIIKRIKFTTASTKPTIKPTRISFHKTFNTSDGSISPRAMPRITMVLLWLPEFPPVSINIGIKLTNSGTAAKDGQLVTSGGRVLGVTATGDTLKTAIDRAYDAARRVHFDGMFMRSDIGKRALEVEGYHG